MATYNFTVRAQDDAGAFADREFSIEVQNTLVDRMLAVDSNHAYASVDGQNFEERTGVGGAFCDYILGKWIIIDQAPNTTMTISSPYTYRLSDDTLVWEEGLECRLANDPAVYEIDEDDEDVLVEEAGPLNGVVIKFMPDRLTVIGNKVYVVAILPNGTLNRFGIVESSDLKNWYLVETEGQDETGDGFGIGGLSSYHGTTGNNSNERNLSVFSNIEYHNGQYVIYNGRLRLFLVSDDLYSWSTVAPANADLLTPPNYSNNNNANFRVTTIKSINGILFIMQGHATATAHFSSRYTIDLVTISQPTNGDFTVASAGSNDIQYNPYVYNNGNLLALHHSGFHHQNRPTVATDYNDRDEYGAHSRDAVILNGQLYTLSVSGNVNLVNTDLSVEKEVEFDGLPDSGILSIAAM